MESVAKNRVLVGLTAAVVCIPLLACAQSPPPRPLIIGVLSYESGEATAPDSVSRSAERGLQMGMEEAAQTARLIGRDVKEKRVVIKRTDDADHAARVMARTTNMSALLVTNPELISAAEGVPGPGQHYAVVVMRTLPSSAELNCSNFSFAIYPSAGALGSVSAPAGSIVALWNSSLEKFGALELNDRYRSRWKTGMTSEAWATWIAVKILSESSLRTKSVEPFIMLDYIKKSEFDGHKGLPLTFRPQDHLLRQPIYIVSAADSKVLDSVIPPRPGATCTDSK